VPDAPAVPARRVLAFAALILLAVPSRADGAPWRWPVRGEVLTPFAVGANPFAAGQHRGIDIAARPGAPVAAACTGRVTFAGRLPGRGHGVTVACGTLVATHLELARVAVRRGDVVRAGGVIGAAAASHVQLGARRAGRRFGYVDPLALLGPDPPPPLGAAPRRPVAPRGSPPALPQPVRAPQPAAAPAPRAPVLAIAGLALLAAGIPLGGLARRRRRSARTAADGRQPSVSAL
jgi:hypothetical protein